MEKEEETTTTTQAPKLDTKARAVATVPPPISTPLAHDKLWKKLSDGTEQIDPKVLKEHLFGEGRLHKEDVVLLVDRATYLFTQEPNILKVKAPLTVCGDIHGQYYDLMKLFEVGGDPGSTTYLFLGDYVDRGSFSIECVLLLYAYKVLYPKTFFLIRGNHECRHLTQYFTFHTECLTKYDEEIYELVMDSFDALPLAAIVNKQFFCVHGGLSPSIKTLEEIQSIDRFCEPPQSGPMCDLLWSDPLEDFSDVSATFEPNEVRGCSYNYGFAAAVNFLDHNNLLSVIRAHEAQDQGYRMYQKHPKTGFPTVITLFSAPNYLDAYGNKGAILRYENDVMNIRQFNQQPHPYWLPNFMDVFTWSVPFVGEKVNEVLLSILNLVDDEKEELEEREVKETEVERERRKERLRAKIRGVNKLMRMYSLLVKERETLMKIKSFTPENRIPQGLLSGGVEAIREALGNFEKAKKVDKDNERVPSTPRPEGIRNRRLHDLRASQESLGELIAFEE